jgi:hypothetical protein
MSMPFTGIAVDDRPHNSDGLPLCRWDIWQFCHPTPCSLAARLSGDLQEIVMMKNYVLADVIVKTAYFSLAAMALVFVSMLYLTTIHP